MNKFFYYFIILITTITLIESYAQEKNLGTEVSKSSANGLTVSSVRVKLSDSEGREIIDSAKETQILKTFAIGVGSAYEESIFDFAVAKAGKTEFVKSIDYKLYSLGIASDLILVIYIILLEEGGEKAPEAKGVFIKGRDISDFPVLVENKFSRLSVILTGGAGTFTDFNAFFAHGAEFTKGSPIANNPAEPGYASWLEGYLELGLGGLIQVSNSSFYPYFGLSGLVTGATGQDLYTADTRGFTDFEKAYLGIIYKNPENGFLANISAGRQNFQLNDGLLFSKYSGSANAGERASLFLSARTTFERTANLKLRYKNFILEGAFLEPEELDFAPSNTQYLLGTLGYNDNSSIDASFTYITVLNSKSKYANVNGITMTKEGLYAFNPKIWINSIGGNNNIKLRSEFVYEGNSNFDMSTIGYYISAGYIFKQLPLSPKLTYRYSYMSGDDSSTTQYERFDPMLTGGLGNWIQGLNFRKTTGNGNIGAHRIQLDIYPSSKMILSVDYFYLWAPQLFNLGGLPPLSRLSDDHYGQELTFTYKYFISNKFTLLSVFSTAFPGEAIRGAFYNPTKIWTTVQLSFFMHIL